MRSGSNARRAVEVSELYDKDGKRKPNAKDVMYGDELDGLGTRFETRIRIQVDGGSVKANGDTIDVKNANRVALILTSGSSFNGFDKSPSKQGAEQSAQAKKALAAASAKRYEDLRDAHIKDYRKLFDRVSISLGKITDQSKLPTDQRIAKYASGGG
jgi:alpha-L-fucosidase 2